MNASTTQPGIDYGNLEREVASIDQAMYVASCFCGSHGPQVIYCTTNKAVADADTGELYLIYDENNPHRHHLRKDENWAPVYRIERLDD
jgi:hypothetical protein